MLLVVVMLLGISTVSESTTSLEGAVLDNGRILVPLRTIFEELGATVKWDNKTKTVTATKQGREVSLKIGSKTTKINGNNVTIDVPAKIKDGRTLVPVSFVSEALGAKVQWDGKNRRAIIKDEGKTIYVYVMKNTSVALI